LERAAGIEPALTAWEADVLPLNYARKTLIPSVFLELRPRYLFDAFSHFLRNKLPCRAAMLANTRRQLCE
jgi:hypothetical protein